MVSEIRPQFSSADVPSPKLNINPDLLGARIGKALRDVIAGRNIVVDVSVRNACSAMHEWRINIPPRELEIYAALGRILAGTNALYSMHLAAGDLDPHEFTVKVWCKSKRQPSIVGSFD